MAKIFNYGFIQPMFNSSTMVALAANGFGLGAVERQPVRWENCAKPVLAAGGIIQH